MTPEQWERVKELFDQGLEHNPESRAAFLDAACRGDAELRAEVEQLLDQHDKAGSFMEKPVSPPGNPGAGRETTFSPGDLVSDRYRIVRFVARGGMGEVYEAQDMDLQITVALKTLIPYNGRSEALIARFKREIQLARQVTHPNVCRVFDLGRCQLPSRGEVPYLTMEFLHGETLSKRIEHAGRFSMEEALPLVHQMVSALSAAHRLGIIHRDFKTSNVMLVPDGGMARVSVTDFGLARSISEIRNKDGALTAPGEAMGTPPYMAPEQYRGEASEASDIYALGVVMYEMVTGEKPNEHTWTHPPGGADMAAAVPPDLDTRWKTTIQKCVQLDPRRRFPRVENVIAALGESAEQETDTLPYGVLTHRRPGRWLAFGGALVLLIGGAGFGLRGPIRRMLNPIPEQKHIAVLPFRNIGNDPASQAFCDGLAETLTSKLSQLERYQKSFWVVPAMDSRTVTDGLSAYRRLGATLIVTGSFQKLSKKTHLIIGLVDAQNHHQLASTVLETPYDDVSQLESQAWIRVTDMLDLQLDAKVVRSLEAGKAKVPGAYEYYEQGLGYLRRNGLENLRHATTLFQRAIARDSSYALPYAGLGSAYQLEYEVTGDTQWLELARKNALRAAELGPGFAPVHLTLGQLALTAGRNDEARRELNLALELDPGMVDAQFYLGRLDEKEGNIQDAEKQFQSAVARRLSYWRGHSELGSFNYRHGQFGAAEREFREVLALQPDDPSTYSNLGVIYMVQGRLEEAVRTFENEIRIKPSSNAYTNMGTCLIWLLKFAEAIGPMEAATKLDPDSHDVWRNLADAYKLTPGHDEKALGAYRRALELARRQLEASPNDAETMASTALYEAHLGNTRRARSIVQRAERMSPVNNEVAFTAALVYHIAGEDAPALEALKASHVQGHSLEDIEREPELAGLRKDPRYLDWLRQVKARSEYKKP